MDNDILMIDPFRRTNSQSSIQANVGEWALRLLNCRYYGSIESLRNSCLQNRIELFHVLTEDTMGDLREQFEEYGHLVIETDVSREMCERLSQQLASEFKDSHRLVDLWKLNEDVRWIALNATILKVLSEIYGAEPMPFQTLNFNRGTQQGLHSDAMHFNSVPPGMMCGVWIALEDVTDRNGPLIYCPGSHRMPFYEWADVGQEMPLDAEARSAVYSEWIADVASRLGFNKKQLILRQGQAVIWAANLLHGGAVILDQNSTRWSQVTHYFFAGTKRFVTPILGKIRTPEWISW